MFYTYKDVKIYYEKIGEGIPIIFLHGWGCSSDIFKVVAKDIAYKYSVYLIDFPSFGKSSEPDYLIDVKAMAWILNNFIRDLNIKMPIIVGHSYGGRIAAEYASRFQCINKLVLIDSAGIKRFRLRKTVKVFVYKIKKWFYKVTKKIMKYNELVLNSGSKDYVNSSAIQKIMLINAVNYDQRKIFKKINCETLIMWGINDTTTPIKDGRKIFRLIKNSELVVIPDASHFPFIENYNYFIKILKSFLEV